MAEKQATSVIRFGGLTMILHAHTHTAPTAAPTAAPPPQTLTLSDEEEIDFGYWEKAALPSDSNKTTKDADLNLL